MKMFARLCKYLADFLLEWEMFQIKVVENSKHAFYVQWFFRKSCRLRDNVEKYSGAREDAGNMAPARGILDK